MKNLTDYFQSLELVAAGVPAETADYFFRKDCMYNTNEKRYEPAFPYIPCWSLGALWEFIFENCGDKVYEFSSEMSSSELMQVLVNTACGIMG